MCSSKKGFSANQFCRVLGVDFKTGWSSSPSYHRRKPHAPRRSRTYRIQPAGGRGYGRAEATGRPSSAARSAPARQQARPTHKAPTARNWSSRRRAARAVRSIMPVSVTAATLRPILVAHVDEGKSPSPMTRDSTLRYAPRLSARSRQPQRRGNAPWRGIHQYQARYFSIPQIGITGVPTTTSASNT